MVRTLLGQSDPSSAVPYLIPNRDRVFPARHERAITGLEQHNVDLAASLEEREAELAAAREANRQLIRTLNQRE
ncbi:hypothetical protein [Streptomyces thermolilacinus]|uniref:hypothetical protein n=1 Tax=Streptomyces thermolilacinus TaxID=285540 RepID=UPI0033C4346F